jgi:hypothetical protein
MAMRFDQLVTKDDLKTALRDLEQRLTIRLGGMLVIATGVVLAGMKFIH